MRGRPALGSLFGGAALSVIALMVSGCQRPTGGGAGSQEESVLPPVGAFIREVPQDEYGAVQVACLTEQRFPSYIDDMGSIATDDVRIEQEGAYQDASDLCEARYPLAGVGVDTSTEEYLRSMYAHQRDFWVPCMRGLGIDLGTLPSEEAFVADPAWYDISSFNAQVADAVADGTLEHENDWLSTCPEAPPA